MIKNAFDQALIKYINTQDYLPQILNPRKESDLKKIEKLISSDKLQNVTDDYMEQLKEYFQVSNPTLVYQPTFDEYFQKYIKKITQKLPLSQQGMWAYFPWVGLLAHILEEKPFFEVRTARNKNLINKEEQEKFYGSVMGIAGLSVGNSVALTIILQGGARHIKLADHDHLALSNINRIRTGVDSLGVNKVVMTARQIYLINPYAKVEIYPEGLSPKNIKRFFKGLDIVIDEIDNLAIKCLIREYSKKYKLPVIMAADNGDNGVVDIERYDQNPQPRFFHGRMGNVSYKKLLGINKFEIGRLITKHVGAETVTDRMKESLQEMGKTIVSWPQLGGAALLNGSAVAYVARKIANNQEVEKNRALISLDEKLTPNYNTSREVKKRKESGKKFAKIFGL